MRCRLIITLLKPYINSTQSANPPAITSGPMSTSAT
jgi:hypothetical protein